MVTAKCDIFSVGCQEEKNLAMTEYDIHRCHAGEKKMVTAENHFLSVYVRW